MILSVLLFQIILAQSPNSKDQIFANPFLADKNYNLKSIVQVKADKRSAGYIDRPENILVQFSVKGEEVYIPHLPQDRFHYQIQLKHLKDSSPIYSISGNTHYRGDSYFVRLRMPQVAQEGYYDFIITAYGDEKKSNKIIKVLPQFFHYRQKNVDVIFLIDNSGSMNRNDPQRLRYKEIYKIFQNPVFASKIDELAVISFADDSQVLFPFDKVTKILQKPITLQGRGNTDFSKPFLLAEKLIRDHRWDQDQKAVIFLTDGVANYPYIDEHLRMRNLGVPIYTVGLSANQKFREYQPEFLKKIARDTRGEFFEVGPNVIGDVFKEFINLSTDSDREFVVMPLKNLYGYNELIHIDYRSSSLYERELNMRAFFKYSDYQKPAQIFKKLPNRITLYPPTLPNQGEFDTRLGLQVTFLWQRKMFFDETTDIQIIEEPVKIDLIYFQQIDFLNYDFRYFPIKNHTEENIFIDIKLSDPNISLPPPPLVFKETPFLLAPGEKRKQTVVFPPLNLLNQDRKEENQTIDIVLETSKGDFINQINFDYLFQVKKTISFSPKTVVKYQGNRFFLAVFISITVLFLLLLFSKLIKNRKKQG